MGVLEAICCCDMDELGGSFDDPLRSQHDLTQFLVCWLSYLPSILTPWVVNFNELQSVVVSPDTCTERGSREGLVERRARQEAYQVLSKRTYPVFVLPRVF